jgi:arylformamidase
MKIHDISLGISPDMPVWPNNPAVELERMNKIEDGANSNVSRLALVVHLPRATRITADDLDHALIPPSTRRLLIKTRNSGYWAKDDKEFHTEFVGIAPSGAEWLVDRRVELIGVDYLSVAPWKESRPTHQILLKAGIVIVEGLNLSKVKPGRYELTCLPLKLIGSDGAPARAILIER